MEQKLSGGVESSMKLFYFATGLFYLFSSYKRQYYEFKSKFQEASAALRASLYSELTLIQIHFPWGGVPLFGGYVAPS